MNTNKSHFHCALWSAHGCWVEGKAGAGKQGGHWPSRCHWEMKCPSLSPVSLSPGFTLQFQSQCADEASIRCWGVMLSASVWDPSISTLIELSLGRGMQDHYAWSSLITWPECACQRANLAVSEAGVGQAFGAGVSREDFLEPKRHLEEWVGFE